MSLLDTLEECSDNDNYINLLNMPFIKEITNGTFNIKKEKFYNLIKGLKTHSYLNLDSKEIVEEIIWKIGGSKKLFNEFFEESSGLCYIKDDVDNIIKCEFKRNIKFPCKRGKLSVRIYNYECCRTAAESGNLRLLKWCRKNGYSFDEETCAFAALNNNLDILKWLKQNGCPWNETTCAYASSGGHLDVLQWCRENGCPWNKYCCEYAAKNGHLEVLKWCRENGCPWDKGTCEAAVEIGSPQGRLTDQLEVLKWCRENGCPWDNLVCCLAAINGELEILKWCRDNGCPWDKAEILYYVKRNTKIYDWVIQQPE